MKTKDITLEGQARDLEEALRTRRTTTLYSVTYRVIGGLLFTIALGLIVLGGTRYANPDALQAWITAMMFAIPAGLCGWVTGTRSTLEVSDMGLRVCNPLNDAVVPWAAIKQVTGTGMAMRIYADGWSVGVYAIQRANADAPGTSAAEQIADILTKEAARRRDGATGVAPAPTKRWLRPYRELAFAAVLAAIGYVWIVDLA